MQSRNNNNIRLLNWPLKIKGICAIKRASAYLFLSSALFTSFNTAFAGDFSMNLGTNPNWPSGSNGPVTFTLTDEFGFQLDTSATIAQTGGTGVGGFPLNEQTFFGTATSIGLIWDSNNGSSGIGEATNTATLSFSSGGTAFATDGVSFVISDIDSVDNNTTTDRCDFITATGNAGNPTLALVNPATVQLLRSESALRQALEQRGQLQLTKHNVSTTRVRQHLQIRLAMIMVPF